MKQFVFFLLISTATFSQQTLTKKLKSGASYIDINTKGIDHITLQTSVTDELIILVSDKDGLGIIDNFICNDYNCVLSIETEIKIKNPNIDKINQLSISPPTKVSAIVKIPAQKKVTILGETIDVKSEGYDGVLRVLIDNGIIRLDKVMGLTEVQLYSGNVFATVTDNSLDLKTRKGKLSLNDNFLKPALHKKYNETKKLIVRTINGNIILHSSPH